MRVRFQNSDGLVFLSRINPAITLDAAVLGETERLNLEQLVRAARFFDLPEQIPGNLNGGAAWYITIEEGGRQHSVKVGQPVQGPAMRKLVERLRKLGASQTRKASRGRGRDSLSIQNSDTLSRSSRTLDF